MAIDWSDSEEITGIDWSDSEEIKPRRGDTPDNPIRERGLSVASLKDIWSRAAGNFSPNQESYMKWLTDRGHTVAPAPDGRIAIQSDEDKLWRYVDPPGTDIMDPLDMMDEAHKYGMMAAGGILGGIGGTAGGTITGPGAVATGVAGGAAGSAVGSAISETMRSGIGKLAGFEDTAGDFGARVGSAAAEGAVAELGGQALGLVGKQTIGRALKHKALKKLQNPAVQKEIQREEVFAQAKKLMDAGEFGSEGAKRAAQMGKPFLANYGHRNGYQVRKVKSPIMDLIEAHPAFTEGHVKGLTVATLMKEVAKKHLGKSGKGGLPKKIASEVMRKKLTKFQKPFTIGTVKNDGTLINMKLTNKPPSAEQWAKWAKEGKVQPKTGAPTGEYHTAAIKKRHNYETFYEVDRKTGKYILEKQGRVLDPETGKFVPVDPSKAGGPTPIRSVHLDEVLEVTGPGGAHQYYLPNQYRSAQDYFAQVLPEEQLVAGARPIGSSIGGATKVPNEVAPKNIPRAGKKPGLRKRAAQGLWNTGERLRVLEDLRDKTARSLGMPRYGMAFGLPRAEKFLLGKPVLSTSAFIAEGVRGTMQTVARLLSSDAGPQAVQKIATGSQAPAAVKAAANRVLKSMGKSKEAGRAAAWLLLVNPQFRQWANSDEGRATLGVPQGAE